MKTRTASKFVSALALLISGVAQAGLIDVTGGEMTSTPGGNDLIPGGISGYYHGPSLGLTVTGDVDLIFTYIGMEADDSNMFSTPDGRFRTSGSSFSAASNAGDTILSTQNGTLSFGFVALDSCSFWCQIFGGKDDSIWNGGQANGVDFWTGQVAGSHGNSWWIGFNDTGSDGDYDDLVVQVSAVSRIDATKVPEPGGIALLGIGLLAIGFMRRRRIEQS